MGAGRRGLGLCPPKPPLCPRLHSRRLSCPCSYLPFSCLGLDVPHVPSAWPPQDKKRAVLFLLRTSGSACPLSVRGEGQGHPAHLPAGHRAPCWCHLKTDIGQGGVPPRQRESGQQVAEQSLTPLPLPQIGHLRMTTLSPGKGGPVDKKLQTSRLSLLCKQPGELR